MNLACPTNKQLSAIAKIGYGFFSLLSFSPYPFALIEPFRGDGNWGGMLILFGVALGNAGTDLHELLDSSSPVVATNVPRFLPG